MPDGPCILGVLADLGGTSPEAGEPGFVRVDRDNLDAVLRRSQVLVEIGDLGLVLPIEAMADFHPDSLVQRVEALRKLMARRDVRPQALGRTAGAPSSTPAARASGNLLDQILSGPPVEPAPLDTAVYRLVRQVTEPLIDHTDETAARRWRAAVDEALSAGVQAIIGNPRFCSIEASWQAVADLVRHVDTGPDLEIRILDVPCDQAPQALREAALAPGAPQFAMFLGAYRFELRDLATAEQLAWTAADCGVPVVADAGPSMLGLAEVAQLGDPAVRELLARLPAAWAEFRSGPTARWLALCLPRILIRPSYGDRADDVASFEYSEGAGGTALFGSAAVAFGRVCGAAFVAEGRGAPLMPFAELDGLPLGPVAGGGSCGCSEVLMSDATIQSVTEAGVIALGAHRDQDRARFFGVATVDGRPLPLG